MSNYVQTNRVMSHRGFGEDSNLPQSGRLGPRRLGQKRSGWTGATGIESPTTSWASPPVSALAASMHFALIGPGYWRRKNEIWSQSTIRRLGTGTHLFVGSTSREREPLLNKRPS